MQLTRRTALQGLGLASLFATSAGRASAVFAGDSHPRLLVVHLRGGLDALAALPPHGDPDFRRVRGTARELDTSDDAFGLKLDPLFALHPALEPLARFYSAGELLILPATGIPDIGKSHDAAQRVLFDGDVDGGDFGWPGRAASVLSQGRQTIWRAAPADLSNDVLFDLALANPGLDIARLCLGAASGSAETVQTLLARRQALSAASFAAAATSAAQALSRPDGPRVALLQLDGVDTHVAQGARLSATLGTLARGVVAFSEAAAAIWRQTVVLGITEFGRSVHFNEQGGTDHGSASVAFLMGGAVAGGRIAGRWPGLAADQLHAETDLAVTTDVRSIVNAVLKDHFGFSSQAMAMVAPNASGLPAISGLCRT
ncbi:DUF1501 domain-containing protein [Mesorhizobium sp. WSM4303]|uniref:DUF1501 domain-containing protein n=1 Tax=unclassified Mesorhizobium TaxID=325217 RepID=UPI00115ED6F6|nr:MULTISPECIES: DUF1501 domain-containing protein [unclassified Mesorhizobium]TRC93523.1 DUF1501 domain-containing protein [Mesorhizobium sp. WSM4306]TRD01012.1 DUF1501 domain-containing protein [Mesorhizobium sp. WSM4303]